VQNVLTRYVWVPTVLHIAFISEYTQLRSHLSKTVEALPNHATGWGAGSHWNALKNTWGPPWRCSWD